MEKRSPAGKLGKGKIKDIYNAIKSNKDKLQIAKNKVFEEASKINPPDYSNIPQYDKALTNYEDIKQIYDGNKKIIDSKKKHLRWLIGRSNKKRLIQSLMGEGFNALGKTMSKAALPIALIEALTSSTANAAEEEALTHGYQADVAPLLYGGIEYNRY